MERVSKVIKKGRDAARVAQMMKESYPKGPMTQIIGFQGPSTIILMVFRL